MFGDGKDFIVRRIVQALNLIFLYLIECNQETIYHKLNTRRFGLILLSQQFTTETFLFPPFCDQSLLFSLFKLGSKMHSRAIYPLARGLYAGPAAYWYKIYHCHRHKNNLCAIEIHKLKFAARLLIRRDFGYDLPLCTIFKCSQFKRNPT